MRATAIATRSWEGETLLTMSQLSRQQEMPIRRASWALRRWATNGVPFHGDPERMIKLPSVIIANVRHSSVEAVREFIDLLGGEPE